MMLRTWVAAASILAASMSAQAPALAQRVDPTRIIDMHVNAERENRSFQGSVVEGQGFRMTFHGAGVFEIVPVVVNQTQGTFRVTVYRGPEGGEATELRAVETVVARLGVPVALRSMPAMGLVVEGIRQAPPPQPRAHSISYTGSPSVRIARTLAFEACCIRCGNVTACGCKVSGDCDFCCEAPCCPPPIETSTDRVLPAERSFVRMAGLCGTPIRNEERIHTSPGRSVLAVVTTR
jgi:hypothetical protein